MNQQENVKNIKSKLTEQKHDLLKSGKIKLVPVSESALHGVTPSVGGGGGSCFPAGTLVTLANGSTKKIEDVKVGEYLLGAHGDINQVLALDRPVVGRRPMVIINDELITTPTHPVLKVTGEFAVLDVDRYFSIENGISQTVITDDYGTEESWILPGLLPEDSDLMQELKVGDVIHTVTGHKLVDKITLGKLPEDQLLYNFVMSGSHTYYAQGYVVTGFINGHDFNYRTWQSKGQPYTVETFRKLSAVVEAV